MIKQFWCRNHPTQNVLLLKWFNSAKLHVKLLPNLKTAWHVVNAQKTLKADRASLKEEQSITPSQTH